MINVMVLLCITWLGLCLMGLYYMIFIYKKRDKLFWVCLYIVNTILWSINLYVNTR
jgi:hypothetical protein